MIRKVSLRKLEGDFPLTCYCIEYWKGIDQRYAMIAAADLFDAEQRFRKIYPNVPENDVISITRVEE